MDTNWYAQGIQAMASGIVAWINNSIQVVLLDSNYTPDIMADIEYADISTYVVSGSQRTLTGRSIVIDDTDPIVYLNANYYELQGVTMTARYAAIYNGTEIGGMYRLIGLIDFEADKAVANGNFRITWDDGCVLKLNAS